MLKKFQNLIVVVGGTAFLALLFSFGLNYVFGFTEPTASPPGGNVAAPLNISSVSQTKAGSLTLGPTSVDTILTLSRSGAVNPVNFRIGTDSALVINQSGFDRLTINSSGNVGIGTTTPAEKLQLHDTAGGAVFFRVRSDTPAVSDVYIGSDGTAGPDGAGMGIIRGGVLDSLAFQTNSNPAINTRMYINNAGNVGIGTTAPSTLLHISGNVSGVPGSSAGLIVTNTAGADLGQAEITLDPAGVGSSWTFSANDDTTKFMIFRGTAADLTIDSSGNVGIGTTAPTIKLAIGDTDTGLNWISDGVLGIITNAQERLRVNASGNVGIGTTTPQSALQVFGYLQIPLSNRLLATPPAADCTLATLGRLDLWYNGSVNAELFACDADSSVGANPHWVLISGSGGGSGTVTSISSGAGINLSPNPITTTGTVSIDTATALTWSGTQTFNGGANFPGSGIWNTSGNVGIGTTTPGTGTKLDISVGTGNPILRLSSIQTSGLAPIGKIQFYNRNGTGRVNAEIESAIGGLDVDEGQLRFYTSNNAALLTERMRITEAGDVGIGTTPGGYRLDVAGFIRVSAMYDRENPGYYVDPNSISNLYSVFALNSYSANAFSSSNGFIRCSGPLTFSPISSTFTCVNPRVNYVRNSDGVMITDLLVYNDVLDSSERNMICLSLGGSSFSGYSGGTIASTTLADLLRSPFVWSSITAATYISSITCNGNI
ncbi:MAG: hypothetical protein HYV52_00755 [Parcubacteria group bacterium]|nr:hypothetical protein [Parcubacteria group bacterium]